MNSPVTLNAAAKVARTADAWRRRWALGRAGVAALASGAVVIALLTLTLGKLTEDVSASNGWQTGDLGEVQMVAQHRNGVLVGTAMLLSRLGSVPSLIVIACVAAVLLWWLGERLIVAGAPLGALLSTGLVVAIGKQVFDRPRPPGSLRLVTENEASFPSGHSADSAALFLTLGVIVAAVFAVRWVVRLLVVAGGLFLTAAIGASRIVLGVHYPTDVMAGWCLGAITAVVIAAVVLVLRHVAGTFRSDDPRPRLIRQTLSIALWSRPRTSITMPSQ